MTDLLYAIAASAALNGVCAALIIGRPRKPVTMSQGIGSLITGIAAAVVIILAAGSLH